MPFFRIPGAGMVHMKLAGPKAKQPKPCAAPLELDGKLVRCCAISTRLCDYSTGKGTTCDAPLCPDHATSDGPDRDLCPFHARLQADDQAGLF